MTDRRKLDDPLAVPLARALAAGLDRSGRDCPDAETLALYFDRALDAAKTARYELHFSACARCQQQLAAMARMASPAETPATEPQAKGISWQWNWRWLAPAAAALGAVTIWVVVQNTTPTSMREPLIAHNEAPAPKVATAPPAEPSADREQNVVAKDQAPAAASGRADLGPAATVAGGKRAQQLRDVKPEHGETQDQPSARKPGAPSTVTEPPKAGVLVEKKDESSDIAFRVESQKPKEEQTRESEAKLATAETRAPQQAAPLAAPQQIAQTPQPPARANEQDTRAARDELKKAQAEPLGPASETVTVEVAPDAAKLRRRSSEVAGRFKAANVVGSKVVWRFGPAGSIEHSDDAGATWQRQASGVEADLLAGSAPSATVCWAVGRGGIVLRTTDGSAWTQLGSPTSQDLTAVVAVDADRATVTTADGKRYATTDGGRTWRSL